MELHLTKTLTDNVVCTLPMPADAQHALNAWIISHADETAAVLEPFGLTVNEVLIPEFRIGCYGCDK